MSFVVRVGPATLELRIADTTRIFLVLGDPVAHSLSPRMQSAAFAAAGMDAVYVACRVGTADLGDATRDLRALAAGGRLGGANVTVPHKRAVGAFLDGLESQARLAGAVNTIRVEGAGGAARLCGENTDVAGLVLALAESGFDLRGARVAVAGAGGMARAAVAAAFLQGAAEVFVYARSVPRVQDLLDEVAGAWSGPLPALGCGELAACAAGLAHADLLVHATTLGMRREDPLAVSLDAAPARLVVCDAVYGAGATPLVTAARARGLPAVDGRALLLHQGAAAFSLWTQRAAPVDAMRAALESPA